MKHLWRSTALLLVLVFGLSACASDVMGPEPTQPVQTAQLDPSTDAPLLGGILRTVLNVVNSLLGAVVRLNPPTTTTTVVQWVGPGGGVLRGAGVELRIPSGALKQSTKITMTVPAGQYVQADFQPHGLVFQKPVELRFDMSGTNAVNGATDSMVGAYFTAPIENGVIKATEVYTATLSRGVVKFKVNHFSMYAPARRGYTAAGG
jgi:hypothetical protein